MTTLFFSITKYLQRKHKFLCFVILHFIIYTPMLLRAQTDSSYSLDNMLYEMENRLDQNDESDYDYTEEWEEQIEKTNYNQHNINELPYDYAIKILGMTAYQYYQLQLYIEQYGPLVTLYEIAAISGFSTGDMERLRHLLTVSAQGKTKIPWRDFIRKSHHNLWVRYGRVLENQAGYDTARSTHYAGTPGHVCFRYTWNAADHIILKIAGEKDPGEQFFKGKQRYGFDLYTGSLCFKNIGLVKEAVVGDYRLNFGQGLVLGSSLLSGRGGEPDALRRFGSGIRAVAPANEGDFLRGFATRIGNHQWKGTLFGGRTFGTLENHYGADLSWRRALFQIGLRAVCHTRTDTASESLSHKIASSFIPNGFNVSADYQAIIKHFILFGEMGIDRSGKLGAVQGILFSTAPTTRLGLLFRHYDRDFKAPLGNAFGAASTNQGESGIYLSIQHIFGRRITSNAYFDYYRLTTPSYRCDAPTACLALGSTTTCQLTRNSQFALRYTFLQKSENGQADHYHCIVAYNRHKLRLLWTNSPHPILRLKTGVEGILNHYPKEKNLYKGILLFQDVAVTLEKPDLSIRARFAFFETDRYDERLYAYEDDVYCAFTIGNYYYKGIRGYIVLRYKYKWLSAWLRVSRTEYLDRKVISSGLNQIDKPHKSEVKAQIMFSL